MDVRRVKRGVSRRAGRALGLALAKTGLTFEARGTGAPSRPFVTSDDLVEHHFTWSPDHPVRPSLADTLRLLDERPAVIVETGSSAWGANSSQLFDAYVSTFGGEFTTVDLRLGPMLKLRPLLTPRSTTACGDSVAFLRRWVRRNPHQKVDLVYLDSWDLDVENPMPAAAHGFSEYHAIQPALRDGSLLLVDDTPSSLDLYADGDRAGAAKFYEQTGMLPGKGMLLDLHLTNQGVEKVHHGYQVLYRF